MTSHNERRGHSSLRTCIHVWGTVRSIQPQLTTQGEDSKGSFQLIWAYQSMIRLCDSATLFFLLILFSTFFKIYSCYCVCEVSLHVRMCTM